MGPGLTEAWGGRGEALVNDRIPRENRLQPVAESNEPSLRDERRMKWSGKAPLLDWVVPLGFGAALCLLLPLGAAFEFGQDEGYEFMKAFLVSLGHPLYRQVWNDQPPLHTELVGLLFRLLGPSALVGRLVTVGFAMVLAGALYGLARERSGRAAGLVAVALLVAWPGVLRWSVSAMLEVPAMAAGGGRPVRPGPQAPRADDALGVYRPADLRLLGGAARAARGGGDPVETGVVRPD